MDPVILTIIRLLIGIPLLLFIPGLLVTITLFPKRGDLTTLERLSLSIVVSILVTIADGVVLLITIGLNFLSVLISILIVVASLAVISFMRLRNLSESDRLTLRSVSNVSRGIIVIVTIFAVVALIGLIFASSIKSNPDNFSEFYVLDQNGKTLDYPKNVTAGDTGKVIVGITNHEANTNTYRYMVLLNNSTIYSSDNITLSKGENHEELVNITFLSKGEGQKLEFILHDSTGKSYELHLWVNVNQITLTK
ncbi:MAG TPA: DUF1616 domain-containing protein [Candidatus Acidoferrales bacterium]|nr:DUF1616 domain-containing protein [Candidatus Acidoferrales bacterium]